MVFQEAIKPAAVVFVFSVLLAGLVCVAATKFLEATASSP